MALHLRDWLYTHALNVSFKSPCWTFDSLLELTHSLYVSQKIHDLDFDNVVDLCHAHLFMSFKDAQALFNFILGLHPLKNDTIFVFDFLLVLFGHLSSHYQTRTGVSDNDTFRDTIAIHQYQTAFWKSQLKEFLCTLNLLHHGPAFLQNCASADALTVSLEILEQTLDALFYGTGPDAFEASIHFADYRQSGVKTCVVDSEKWYHVGTWIQEMVRDSVDMDPTRIPFSFIDQVLEWGLDLDQMHRMTSEFVLSQHGLVQGLTRDFKECPIVVNGKTKAIVVSNHEHVQNKRIILQGLIECQVYLLGPISSVLIQGCLDTHVYIGSVSQWVRVEQCKAVQLSGALSQVWISQSNSTKVSAFTEFPTVICDSFGIVLSPCDFTYDGLQSDVNLSTLDLEENQWDQSILYGLQPGDSKKGRVRLLDPSEFKFEILPFSRHGLGDVDLWQLPIPNAFKSSNDEHDRVVKALKDLLTRAGQIHAELGPQIQKGLYEWIQSSGQMPLLREYVGLSADVAGLQVSDLE